MNGIVHLAHSINPEHGGVAEAIVRLNMEMKIMGLGSRIIDDPTHNIEDNEIIIAHGLWQ